MSAVVRSRHCRPGRNACIGADHPRSRHHRSVWGSRREFPGLGCLRHACNCGFDDGASSRESWSIRGRTFDHLRRHHQLHRGLDYCSRPRRSNNGRQSYRGVCDLLLRDRRVASHASASHHPHRGRDCVDADRRDHASLRDRLDKFSSRKCSFFRGNDGSRNHRIAISSASSARPSDVATLVHYLRDNRRLCRSCIIWDV